MAEFNYELIDAVINAANKLDNQHGRCLYCGNYLVCRASCPKRLSGMTREKLLTYKTHVQS